MVTLSQLNRKKRSKKKKKIYSVLSNRPQLKGICLKIFTKSPKKPNSAIRKVAKVKLSINKEIIAYIPGENHKLKEHDYVLIKGGKTQDLPGVNYKIIRGVLDANNVASRVTSRSKYGVKK